MTHDRHLGSALLQENHLTISKTPVGPASGGSLRPVLVLRLFGLSALFAQRAFVGTTPRARRSVLPRRAEGEEGEEYVAAAGDRGSMWMWMDGSRGSQRFSLQRTRTGVPDSSESFSVFIFLLPVAHVICGVQDLARLWQRPRFVCKMGCDVVFTHCMQQVQHKPHFFVEALF